MQSNQAYTILSKFYDLFDLIFLLGGKGNPRPGLLSAISDTSLRILDLCVGTAASSLLVASHHPKNQIVGVDISDAMLSVARRKIRSRNLSNLEVQNMSAAELQFPDQSFDVVMVSFALHEFEADLREKIFGEAARVLKPGGTFCVIDFARQKSYRNRDFIKLWILLEPAGFKDFLGLDWRSHLVPYGLSFASEKAYSFSNLYVLRKV
jgi:demethylmenaquinone methyltransferase/2-methoxy-6-polyprenyl-1,4-benzoquinol methylase